MRKNFMHIIICMWHRFNAAAGIMYKGDKEV